MKLFKAFWMRRRTMLSMKPHQWITSRGTAILGSLVLLSPLAFADVQCVQPVTGAQPQIAQQLKSFEQTAHTTSTQLDRYAASVRAGNPHRTTHSVNLNDARDNVNKLGRQMAEMEKLNAEGSAVQQAALREARPHLELLASHVETAINTMNEGTSSYRSQDFRETVKGMYEQANLIHSKVDALTDFEQACSRAIEVTGAGNSAI
jgi:hypothetical protein